MFANDATKLSPIPQNMLSENFSYNILLVDVTLAVCKLLQKSFSNVNISASAVPKGFLVRVKIPMISVELLPVCEIFFCFSVAKFCAYKQQVEANENVPAMFIV